MTTPVVSGATEAPSSSNRGTGNQPTTNTFLQLLVAQLRTQNPLEPQKGTEFVTQLAQFNTLEQLIAIRSDLDAMRTAAQSGPKQTT